MRLPEAPAPAHRTALTEALRLWDDEIIAVLPGTAVHDPRLITKRGHVISMRRWNGKWIVSEELTINDEEVG